MNFMKSKSPKGQGKMDAQDAPGKPSLSIAIGVQKQAKKKKMAGGGEVAKHHMEHMGSDSGVHCDLCKGACMMASGGAVDSGLESIRKGMNGGKDENPKGFSDVPLPSPAPVQKASGGAISASSASNHDVDDHYDSIADAIMRKRKIKMMAEGGVADNDEETPASLSPFDDSNAEAAMKENYGPQGQMQSSPEDSDEMGDAREDDEEDEHDMVSAIRKRMKMRVLGQRG